MINWIRQLLFKLTYDESTMIQRNNALDKLEKVLSEKDYDYFLEHELNKAPAREHKEEDYG